MNPTRFDSLVRALTLPAPRRFVAGGLLGMLVFDFNVATAKKRKKKGKKKKTCAQTCRSGCCTDPTSRSKAACQPGTSDLLCGSRAQQCQDCSDDAFAGMICREQRCCVPAGGTCDHAGECCGNLSCLEENCCAAEGQVCGSDLDCCDVFAHECRDERCLPRCSERGEGCDVDEDCCDVFADECRNGTCQPREECDPPCGGGTHFCCSNASDGRHLLCLFSDRMNCPIPNSQFVANCPREVSDMCCVGPDDTYSCPGDPPGCPPGDTQVPEITCLD